MNNRHEAIECLPVAAGPRGQQIRHVWLLPAAVVRPRHVSVGVDFTPSASFQPPFPLAPAEEDTVGRVGQTAAITLVLIRVFGPTVTAVHAVQPQRDPESR